VPVPITLEINLRVPDMPSRDPGAAGERVANRDVRFWKAMTVPALPKVGDSLVLSTSAGAFSANVKRLEWDDAKDCFVAACQYAKRSIAPEEYDGLRADPDWTMRPLLPSE
jgi:hypothetical protein